MFRNRFIFFIPVSLLFILLLSCSSTSETTKNEPPEELTESKYPAWYNSNRSTESDDAAYYGYATAIASDSIRSSQKAGTQAKAELKTAISSRLESIRNDATVELGSNSGLDSPKFIVALRNAEDIIPSVAEVNKVEVIKDKDQVYRSFSKASVDKEMLIRELDKALSANGKAWNAMKESQAFTSF